MAIIISPSFVFSQSITVSGKVSDSKGNPIISASVNIVNTKKGTATNNKGEFKINTKPEASVLFSALGYSDTIISIENRTILNVTLLPKVENLKEITIEGNNQNTDPSVINETAREEFITNTFQDYLRSAQFSNGTFVVSSLTNIKVGNVTSQKITNSVYNGFGPLSTVNSGIMLPVIEHKEETKGSRYLLKKYAQGLIIDSGNNLIVDSTNILNYDKIDGQLMMAIDRKNFLEIDKEKVIGFALKTEDTTLIFLNVPILSKVNYFLLIANGPKYSAYKSIRSKFVKSNYSSNGLTEIGNNYDEYVDTEKFYWVDQRANTAGFFELKKKSLKAIFPSEKAKIEEFFLQHKYDDIDENFVKKLIDFLNH